VKSKPRSVERFRRPIIFALLDVLAKVRQIMNEIPPLNQPMRSGNRGFRTFLTRVYTERADILSGVSTNPDTHEFFV
jgi:hypothetical protein